jgi:hypothetical protein
MSTLGVQEMMEQAFGVSWTVSVRTVGILESGSRSGVPPTEASATPAIDESESKSTRRHSYFRSPCYVNGRPMAWEATDHAHRVRYAFEIFG